MKIYFISIIIPVYNDPVGIRVVLESLIRQDYPKDSYEIIVVNNNSSVNIQEVVDFDKVLYIEENNIQSSYAARNKGIVNARGDIMAFTDADCICREDWLSNGARYFSDNLVSLVAGRIEFTFLSQEPNIFEFIDSDTHFDQKKYVNDGFGATANLFVRKKVFDNCGMFDRKLLSSGDYEFCIRAKNLLYNIAYAEDAVVYHPARNSFQDLLKKTKRIGKGQNIMQKNKKLALNLGLLFFKPRFLFRSSPYFKNFNLLKKIKIIIVYNFIKYFNIYFRLNG